MSPHSIHTLTLTSVSKDKPSIVMKRTTSCFALTLKKYDFCQSRTWYQWRHNPAICVCAAGYRMVENGQDSVSKYQKPAEQK